MNSTYAQKSSPVQKAADTKAASVLDSSSQGKSLQRKADMVNGAVQRKVTTAAGNGIPNRYGGDITEKIRKDAREAISSVTFEKIGGAGTISTTKKVRVDNQGALPNGYNIQAQLNGERGHTTIAHALVYALPTTTDNNRLQYQNREICNNIKKALNKSFDSGLTYLVNGIPSN